MCVCRRASPRVERSSGRLRRSGAPIGGAAIPGRNERATVALVLCAGGRRNGGRYQGGAWSSAGPRARGLGDRVRFRAARAQGVGAVVARGCDGARAARPIAGAADARCAGGRGAAECARPARSCSTQIRRSRAPVWSRSSASPARRVLEDRRRRSAFLSADFPMRTPFGRTLRIEASMPWSLARLRDALRGARRGSVDIRKRGSAVDVDEMQRRLKLDGTRPATVVLTRVSDRPWAIVCSSLAARRSAT